jgi:hypothetical protein
MNFLNIQFLFFRTTGNELQLEVWRTNPPIQSRSTHHNHNRPVPLPTEPIISPPKTKTIQNANRQVLPPNINEARGGTNSQKQLIPSKSATTSSNANSNINQNKNKISTVVSSTSSSGPSSSRNNCQNHHPPTSILKTPAPPPPKSIETTNSTQPQQPQQGSAWRIRFNIEVGQGTYV